MNCKPMAALFWLVAPLACDEGIGGEGTEIPEPLTELSGGVIFSTAAIQGANGYDLFWAPVRGASPVGEQGFLQLTTADTDDFQPAVARNGSALAFARSDEGIFLINANGRISRVSDVRNTSFVDSLPAVDAEGTRVAWVREDTSRPIGQTGLVQAAVWVANADGTEPRPVNPKRDVVQDAPAFDPTPGSTRLAWSEFNATTLGPVGPTSYGVWLHDLAAFTGRFVCQGAFQLPDGEVVRCFGQHLTWPFPGSIVLGQQLLEIDPAIGPVQSTLSRLLNGLGSAPGTVDRTASPSGFYPPFPLSAHYLGDTLIVDGLFRPFDGNQPTLAFFLAGSDGREPVRLQISGFGSDFDPGNTAGYLFSRATPQLIP